MADLHSKTKNAVSHANASQGRTRLRLYGWIILHLLVFILVPFFLFESSITAWGQAWVDNPPALHFLALMIILALTLDVLLPIPASLVSLAASVLIGGAVGAITLFTGLMFGSLFGYYTGRFARESLLKRLLSDASRAKLSLLSSGRLGALTLVLARPLPVLAETSVILAGMERYPFQRFVQISLIANALVTFLYMIAGQAAQL